MCTEALDASQYIVGSADDRLQFARDLVSRLNEEGFVKLRNHGISTENVREIFSWQKRFFDLSTDEKMSCIHKGGTGPVRGFNSSDQEKSSKLYPGNAGIPDAKDALESLNIGPLNDTTYPNQWIAEDILPSFRQHIESYYHALQKTSNVLFQAIELGLALPAGALLSRALPNVGELRLNHYPRIPRHELLTKNTRRIWPHTDFGTLSLLFQDSAGGLEFEDRRSSSTPNTFVPVTSEDPSDLIVTVGDILQRWTNDGLKAGLHRVSVPRHSAVHDDDVAGEEEDCMLPDRYSLVFFSRPSGEKSAGPMRDFVSEKRPACYEEISASEHLARRNRLVY
ncbi:MAG: hypothetical protein Q9216_005788 [Gyalolechia sp. 2 TL-2023]